jgi:hypothetical protein
LSFCFSHLSYIVVLIRIIADPDTGANFDVELKENVNALDSGTINRFLSVFPWARFRKTKGAINLHILLDLRKNIPSFVDITDGKMHNVNVLDILVPEVGAIYVMDREYLYFERLFFWAGERLFLFARSQTQIYSVCYRIMQIKTVDCVVTGSSF